MHDIFISYSKKDRKFAESLANALTKEGFVVWWDIDIPTGKTFDNVIEKAIDNAKCVIVLWSKNSVTSEWVHIEAAEGKKRDILIPVRIEDVEIPIAFRRRQTADLINWNNKSTDILFKRIIADVGRLINDDEPKIGQNNTFEETKKISGLVRKYFWLIIIFLSVFIFYKLDFFSKSSCVQKVSGIITNDLGINSEINRNAGVHIQLLSEGKTIDEMTVDGTGAYEFCTEPNKEYSLIAGKSQHRTIVKEFNSTEKEFAVFDIKLPKLKCYLKLDSINFDFDKLNINAQAAISLEPLISALKTYDDLSIKIEAHTDSREITEEVAQPDGSIDEVLIKSNDRYKVMLTERQASSVRDYLISKGVDKSQILSAVGYGASQLLISDEQIKNISSNQAKIDAHAKNRRAEIIFVGCND